MYSLQSSAAITGYQGYSQLNKNTVNTSKRAIINSKRDSHGTLSNVIIITICTRNIV